MNDKTFTLIKNDGDGKIAETVISIKSKKGSTEYGACRHNSILVDEDLWRIECAKCGKSLDPIQYLVNLAGRERMAEYRLTKLQERYEKVLGILEKKTRTKCEHCGKLTPIKGLN